MVRGVHPHNSRKASRRRGSRGGGQLTCLLDALPGQDAEGLFLLAPTEIHFSGADFLLTSSFRGGVGRLKMGALTVGPQPLLDSELGLAPTSTLDHLPFHPVEVVKGDSQEEDNAAVPDQQLWLKAFLVCYDDPGCLERHRLALRLGNCWAGGMTGGEGPPPGWQALRLDSGSSGYGFEHRRALRGYYSWQQFNVPWQSNLPTPAQMVRWRMDMVFGGVCPMGEWTAKGRLSYNKQWALLRGSEEGASTPPGRVVR